MGYRYIHYGSPRFELGRWTPIQAEYGGMFKPLGGLWASPVDAPFGWSAWCEQENFRLDCLRESFTFELKPGARVLELTPDNVWELPQNKDALFPRLEEERSSGYASVKDIDFVALAQQYDVLECSLTKYPSLYWSLYGWDCDCILVMNPDVIMEV